jgi:tRNA(Ile)-lysidine synthase
VRRGFLEEARRLADARFVLTGHTRDDQAETFLLNLLRGAGPRGLGAMLPVGPGPWARPFLDIDKAELLAFLLREGLPFREDATNRDSRFARNRVRQRLVPLLQAEFTPAVTRVLAREAALFAELDEYLAGLARNRLDDLLEARPEGLRLDLRRFREEPPALQRCLLREALERLFGDLRECGADTVEGLRELAGEREGSSGRTLPRGGWARREYDELLLARGTPEPDPAPAAEAVDPDRPAEVRWEGRRLRWGPGPAVVPDPGEEDRAVFDREALVPPLRVRPARPGDRLEPAGMPGSRKLQDLFTDQKVPRHLRDRIPVLCDNGGPRGEERILWVIGRRRSKHAPVGPETARAVVFHAEPEA